ncbi:hypothetical protein HP564_13155 [Pantoea sp. KPR_PJ]
MRKVKVVASHVANSSEEMWFIVDFDDNNHILTGTDEFGLGSVWWQRWENFKLDEYSDSQAMMVWHKPEYARDRGTLDILNRRLATGELIRYVDGGEHYMYRIISIEPLNTEVEYTSEIA